MISIYEKRYNSTLRFYLYSHIVIFLLACLYAAKAIQDIQFESHGSALFLTQMFGGFLFIIITLPIYLITLFLGIRASRKNQAIEASEPVITNKEKILTPAICICLLIDIAAFTFITFPFFRAFFVILHLRV